MATDATGTPTSPDNIPTYNTAGDPPSGKGFNAAMALIQTALSKRLNVSSLFTSVGDLAYASGAGVAARLGIGSSGQVLTVAGGVPTWAPATGGMTLISDTLYGADTANPWDTNTVLGGNIPQTYKHLRLIVSARSTMAAAFDGTVLRVNGDSTANYTYGEHYNQNNVMSVGGGAAQTSIHVAYVKGATSTAGMFSTVIIDIPDYTNTLNCKSLTSTFSSPDATYASHIEGTSGGGWFQPAAVTRLQLILGTGPNWKAGSRFSLYGIS